jgi:hypothetical protein
MILITTAVYPITENSIIGSSAFSVSEGDMNFIIYHDYQLASSDVFTQENFFVAATLCLHQW